MAPTRRLRLWSLGCLLALAFAGPAPAQPPAPQTGTLRDRVRNPAPEFLVRAAVNHATRSYREGDALSVHVACEVDAYVYVLYQQADGSSFQIFPNRLQPDNHVAARQAIELPGHDDLFRWQIAAPFGKEVIKVIASREP